MEENFAKVKISDIAKQAGVSSGTVDRVIHNRGEVAAKTREKILAIIREMNYEPDILASTLASKKSMRIATLLPESEVNPFWEKPNLGLQAAWDEIKHFGVMLEKYFFDYHNQNSFSGKLDEIITSKPDGLIMSPIFTGQTRLYMEEFNRLKIPVIFLNTLMENQSNIAFVGQDPEHSGRVAAHLLDYCMHEDNKIFIINIINHKGGNSHILKRENGFRNYFKMHSAAYLRNLTTININAQNQSEIDILLHQNIGKLNSIPGTKGIFVTNSRVFYVADYLLKSNIDNVKLIGYDLLEQNINHLHNKTIDFLIGQKPWEQGHKSLMALFNALIMKKQILKNQFLPIDIITKENIDFYLKN